MSESPERGSPTPHVGVLAGMRLVLIAASIALVACASTKARARVDRLGGINYAPRDEDHVIHVYERADDITRPYEKIGRVLAALKHEQTHLLMGTWSSPLASTLQDVLPEMEKRAREIGGDALILRDGTFGSTVKGSVMGMPMDMSSYLDTGSAFGNLEHYATVIRYTVGSEPSASQPSK